MNNLKGSRISHTDLNLLIYGKMDPDWPETTDIDINICMPNIPTTGKPIIIGTSGNLDFENDQFIKKFFKNEVFDKSKS